MNPRRNDLLHDRRKVETLVVAGASLAALLALAVVAVQVEAQQSPAGYAERHADGAPTVRSLDARSSTAYHVHG
jgi:Spy/CpxP family protein refolding chaperone